MAAANNGYLQEAAGGPLLAGAPTVNTVVQVSSAGTRTMVLPGRAERAKERCLLAALVVLLFSTGVALLLLVNTAQNTPCSNTRK